MHDADEALPDEVIVAMEAPFADSRGEIQPLVDRAMRSAVLISSKKGTVRANHYHKTDWHYCYVLEGRIEYHHRPHGSDAAPETVIVEYHHRPHGSDAAPETVIVEKGQIFFTPPMVDHAMVFVEDTTFLTLGRNSRAQEVYEADVERIELVAP